MAENRDRRTEGGGRGTEVPTLTLEERYELIRQADARAMQRIIDGDY